MIKPLLFLQKGLFLMLACISLAIDMHFILFPRKIKYFLKADRSNQLRRLVIDGEVCYCFFFWFFFGFFFFFFGFFCHISQPFVFCFASYMFIFLKKQKTKKKLYLVREMIDSVTSTT